VSMDDHPSFPGIFLSLEEPLEQPTEFATLEITLSDLDGRRPDRIYSSGQRPGKSRTSDQEKSAKARRRGTKRTHRFRWW